MKVFAKLVLTLAVIAPAWGEPLDEMSSADKRGFDAYLQTSAYAGRMSDMLKMAKQSSFKGCEALSAGPPSVAVLKPIKIGPDGAPVDGVWKVAVPAEGCGTSRLINAFFVVGKENKIFFMLAVPGTTRGDPQLQRDTVFYALMAPARKNIDCKKPEIINSRFDLDETSSVEMSPLLKSLGTDRIWREVWTVNSCGRYFEVTVRYTHNKTGTNITASESDVVEVSKEQAAKQ